MTKTKRIFLAAAVMLTVFLLQLCSTQINALMGIGQADTNFYWSIIGQIIKYLLPSMIIILLFHPAHRLMEELGIGQNFLQGLQFGFLFTLPMLIGYFLMGQYNQEQTILENLLKAFKDGFREEIFYRAFLFGQLFRHVKLGFVPAVLINGLIFGLMHIYQAHSIAESFGIFAITFAGAIWFAWLYMEWKQNLWLPIFMHLLMNFYWHLFSTEHSAMGGLMLNLPRILTISISIYITVKLCRKANWFAINKHNLLVQKG
jgi:uncharacterized protein